jgi:hypothetical protein
MSQTALRAFAVLLSAALLAGCDEDALRPRPAATASASSGPPSSVAAAEPAGPAYAGPFAVVARSPDAFELYPLQGALFVDAAGFLAILAEGPLRQSPAVMRGLENGASGRIAGRYPEGAWLMSGKGTYRWSGDRWVEEKLLREHETLLDVAGWGEHGAIAAIARPGNDMRFALAVTGQAPLSVPSRSGGPPSTPPKEFGLAVAPPKPSPADPHHAVVPANPEEATSPEGGEKEAPCKVRMKPRGVVLAGLPSGELYAAGYECEPVGHGGAIVERWDPRREQEHGTVEALPRPEGGGQPAPRGVLAKAPSEVFVYGSEGVPAAPYLARFDGNAWSVDKVPFGGAVETLAMADDGALWAAAGGAVWKKAGATWEKVPLPAGLAAHAVWPRGPDVWVSARELEGKARAVLLRTGAKPGDLVRLPPRNAMAGATATHGGFFATSACDKVYVDLEVLAPGSAPAIGKRAEIPKGFPWLKALLHDEFANLQPVLEDDGTAVHVGVPVPSREVGRRLMAAYQEQNPKAKPNLLCHDPAIAKAIKL